MRSAAVFAVLVAGCRDVCWSSEEAGNLVKDGRLGEMLGAFCLNSNHLDYILDLAWPSK